VRLSHGDTTFAQFENKAKVREASSSEAASSGSTRTLIRNAASSAICSAMRRRKGCFKPQIQLCVVWECYLAHPHLQRKTLLIVRACNNLLGQRQQQRYLTALYHRRLSSTWQELLCRRQQLHNPPPLWRISALRKTHYLHKKKHINAKYHAKIMKKIVEATSVDNTIATVMMAFADPNEDRDLSYNLKLAVASDPASVSSGEDSTEPHRS